MSRESRMRLARGAWLLVWRTLLAALVIPSVMVGSLVLMLVLAGGSPVRSTLEALYQYADESIRPAPAGFVLEHRCIKPRQAPDRKPPSRICESQERYLVSVSEVISDGVEVLFQIYLVLVSVSVVFILATSPWPFSEPRKAGSVPLDDGDRKP